MRYPLKQSAIHARISIRALLNSILLASLVAQLGAAFAIGEEATVQDVGDRDFHGLPYYQFFGSKDFDSSASARFIEVSSDGSFFYGDQNWLFRYDGVSWQKLYYNGKGSPIVTTVRWEDDGEIYAGSFNRIGTVDIDDRNEIAFKPFSEEPVSMEAGEFFRSIQVSDTHVYFEGKRTVAIYDKATGEIRSKYFNTWITASFFYHGEYYVATDFQEIYRDRGETFELVESLTKDTKSRTMADAVTLPNGNVVLGSERNGLYVFDGESIKPAYPNFKSGEDQLLSDLEITEDGRIIVALMGLGVVVLDSEGNTLETFSDEMDYRFKSARAVTVDHSGTIWAMFNASVAKILLDSPLTAIDERIRPSLFYGSSHIQGNDLYLRNFYVIYKAEFDENNRISSFRNALPGSDLRIWVVEETQNGLILATDGDGIYRLANDTLTRLADGPAYDRFHQSSHWPDLFVAANSREFALYRLNGDTMDKVFEVPNPYGFVNRLSEDRNGAFWIEYGLNSAGKITIENESISLTYYGKSNGLPDGEWMTLWMHEKEALYTCALGVLRLDPQTQSFRYDSILADQFPNETLHLARVITDPHGNIWLSANDVNTILWKQEDGTYLKDRSSLSEMGEPYFEYITFFGDNQAIIVTSFELFHFRKLPNSMRSNRAETLITRISDISGERILFTSLGNGSKPASQILPYRDNNLRFRLSNNYSLSTLPIEFQYYLKGFSSSEIPQVSATWSTNSETYFTNLDNGNYTFMARARLGNGDITPWTEYGFEVLPPFYRTYWAYLAYLAILIVLVHLSIRIYSRQLMLRNLRLKAMVDERTHEVEQKNVELERQADVLAHKNVELATQSDEIHRNARELSKALTELRTTQDQLLLTARKAGMSEVATNVLHNVGNVLNSVNVGLASLSKRLSGSRIDGLRRLTNLISEHRDGLAEFLSSNPKGKTVPDYLIQLSNTIEEEFKTYKSDVAQMEHNVDHIKRIIATQQSLARNTNLIEPFDMGELVESAYSIAVGHKDNLNLDVSIDLQGDLEVQSDKHRVLQILINLIKNAEDAILESTFEQGKLTITCRPSSDTKRVNLTISDNGVGIRDQDRHRIFTHGFTTKTQGNGFGLHASAIDIKSLGGELQLSSEGPGQGATATLTIPKRLEQNVRETAPRSPEKN